MGFAFLGVGELLYRETLLPGFELLAGVVDQFEETPRELVNALGLSSCDGFGWNEFGADADGSCARQNEVSGGVLIHASGGDERNLRQRGMEGLDVAVSANRAAGEHFDQIGAAGPSGDHLGGRQSAGKDSDVALGGSRG